MRKYVVLFVFACAVLMTIVPTGCTDKAPKTVDTPAVDSVLADTIDSVDTTEQIIAETPMPKAADQLFDDFFFNFMSSKKVQRNRIKFPVPVVTGKKQKMVERKSWVMDHFFARQGYYTLIYDNVAQMDNAKSTKIDTVVVERINLSGRTIEQFWFDHQNGHWVMNGIHNIGFNESKNASFLEFLRKFFANGGEGYVKNPLPYSGPDPNGEETKIVNTKIDPSEWSGFLPEVPGDKMYNILYGQKYGNSDRKILVFKGLSNGLETRLSFRRHGKSWRLVKLEAF